MYPCDALRRLFIPFFELRGVLRAHGLLFHPLPVPLTLALLLYELDTGMLTLPN